MSWIYLLGIAVFFTAIAALLGAQPSGARPVANTRMMGAARTILFVLAAVFAALGAQAFFTA